VRPLRPRAQRLKPPSRASRLLSSPLLLPSGDIYLAEHSTVFVSIEGHGDCIGLPSLFAQKAEEAAGIEPA
jgi:hypothetical protein